MHLTEAGSGGAAAWQRAGIGSVMSARGSSATLSLPFEETRDGDRATVGRFVAIEAGGKSLIGVITEMSAEGPGGPSGRNALASLDLVGEIVRAGGEAHFRRGVSSYPAIGDVAELIGGEELRLIYRSGGRRSIEIGTLAHDQTIAAGVNVDDLVSRHFAVLGTTGVGKSSGVAVLLNEILLARPDLRVFMLDGHNEYGRCFGEQANVLGVRNLRLPFWMLNFEETVDVVYGGRPAVAEEVEILAELIPRAKSRYNQYKGGAGERLGLKKEDPRSDGITVDTPIPYLIQDLLSLIDDRMGRLDNRSMRLHYHRLMMRIDTIRNDARYAFLFENANVGGDIMGEIINQLFQLEPGGKPITVMQLGGLPAEVVDAVVCVLARTAFEFGLWSEGAAPLLFVCEEAHRYASADASSGFHPTRRALSRIAKEGRKYGVFLGLVSQRPAELDPTIISQCSTLFVMRLANERDQALLRSAVPDAAANLLAFVPSLGTREVIGFGEGVPVPARMTFKELPPGRVPRTDMAGQVGAGASTPGFVEAVVERWRGATMSHKPMPGEAARRDAAAVPTPSQPRQIAAVEQIRQRLLRAGPVGEASPPPGEAGAGFARPFR
jgi:DNA helicase HerA-like ATPase